MLLCEGPLPACVKLPPSPPSTQVLLCEGPLPACFVSELGGAAGGGFDQLPEAWRERLLRTGGAAAGEAKGARAKGAMVGAEAKGGKGDGAAGEGK